MADDATKAVDLLAEFVDGYINGLSPEEFQDLMDRTVNFLENCDPGDEDDSYGHGV